MLSLRTASFCASLIILGGASALIESTASASSAFVPPTAVAADSSEIAQMPQAISRFLSRRIQRDLAQRLHVSADDIAILEATPETWPDQCLGLARPNQRCMGGEVRGWRVQAASAQQQWVYRSDRFGQRLRMEPLAGAPEFGRGEFSAETGRLLLETVSAQVDQPLAKLQILEVQPAVWSGCLGIFAPGQACTLQAIAGFRAIVSDGQAVWVYHLSENGDRIAQNATASGALSAVETTFIPLNLEISSPDAETRPDAPIVFQSQVSGGLTGFVKTTTLSADGTLYQEESQWRNGGAQPTRTVIKTLSPAEVEAFQNQLQQLRFPNFNQMRYLTQAALADYPMTQLQIPGITVEYIDLEIASLPPALQNVIADWQALSEP